MVTSSHLGDFIKGKSQHHWRRHLPSSVPTSCFMRYLANVQDFYKLEKLDSAPLKAMYFNSYVCTHFNTSGV